MNYTPTPEYFADKIKFHSTNPHKNKNTFIPNKSSIKNPGFPYVHAYVGIEMNASSSCIIPPMPYFLLAYIRSGIAKLTINSNDYELKRNTLVILPLDYQVTFQSVQTPFIEDTFFFTGDILRYLTSRIMKNTDIFISHNCSNYIELTINNMKAAYIDATFNSDIIIFNYFTNIITDFAFYDELGDIVTPNIELPKHVKTIKQILESEYKNLHTLESLEDRIGISKYRLCHDFSKTMNISPIQYLNKIRIEKSKILLENTNLTIHEIGENVGIDNPTHFIKLFKRNCNMTPMQYRKMRTHGFISET